MCTPFSVSVVFVLLAPYGRVRTAQRCLEVDGQDHPDLDSQLCVCLSRYVNVIRYGTILVHPLSLCDS